MKKHYATHVEDTDKLISVAGPILEYETWYEQYKKLMEEQAQRKYGLYTPTSEGDDDDFPSIPGMVARYSALGLTNEQMAENPVWKDLTGNGHDLQMKNFAWKEGSGISDIYPGALVFDGVDDYGTCDNFPILTKEKGYTVVALRHWISKGEGLFGLVSNARSWFEDGTFVLEYFYTKNLHSISFGAIKSEKDLPHILTYQTSKSYNGVSITPGSFKGTDVLHVGKLAPINVGNYANAAIWELVFLDHDATEEELTKIKDYFVKTYPWLFPDQAWTVTGKTNEDTDRVTIANITGNGNDLVLSNFAFSGNSGYGSYVYNFNDTSIWFYPSYNATIERTSSTIHVIEAKTDRPFLEKKESTGGYNKMKIKVTGIKDGELLRFMSDTDIDNTINIEKDGIYSLPGSDKLYYGFRLSNSANTYPFNCDITIEQIPEYEGYLVTDGVDDKVVSSDFVMDKEFTIVGEWKLVSDEMESAGIVKPSSLFVFNKDNGLIIYINNTSKGQVLNTKSLKAICSDGRVYYDDWSEMLVSEEQPIASSNKYLMIGSNGNHFTKIALKNLAIYNHILSKDDCIKAYDYLQTLKAK